MNFPKCPPVKLDHVPSFWIENTIKPSLKPPLRNKLKQPPIDDPYHFAPDLVLQGSVMSFYYQPKTMHYHKGNPPKLPIYMCIKFNPPPTKRGPCNKQPLFSLFFRQAPIIPTSPTWSLPSIHPSFSCHRLTWQGFVAKHSLRCGSAKAQDTTPFDEEVTVKDLHALGAWSLQLGGVGCVLGTLGVLFGIGFLGRFDIYIYTPYI